MDWIKNQPVFFGNNNECSSDEIPPQLVDITDISQVQFTIEPCEDAIDLLPEVIVEDDFTLSDNWSIIDGVLCCSGSAGGGVNTDYQFDVTKYYKINITVDSISAGGSLLVALGSTIIGYIYSSGTYSFYGFPVSVLGSTSLIINQNTTGTEACASSITAYEVLIDSVIAVYDSNNNYITEISYPEDIYFSFSKNTVTITLDWSELVSIPGCYHLCFLDPCINTNGQNYAISVGCQNFQSPGCDQWIFGDGWVQGVGMATGTGSGSLVQNYSLPNLSASVCLNVTVQNLTGVLNVYFGTALVDTITVNGTKTITGVAVGNLDLSFTLASGGNVDITNVSPCGASEYVCNYTSNIFKVGDYSNDCTLLINVCNNEDGLGFVFEGSGFSPRVRLESKLRQAKYKNERTVYEDSVGTKKNVYFSGRKSENLCIDQQPGYIHDFLRLALGFDNFYINSVKYFADDDEYNVEYDEWSDNVGKVRILVSEQTQNVKNINRTDTENDCTL